MGKGTIEIDKPAIAELPLDALSRLFDFFCATALYNDNLRMLSLRLFLCLIPEVNVVTALKSGSQK